MTFKQSAIRGVRSCTGPSTVYYLPKSFFNYLKIVYHTGKISSRGLIKDASPPFGGTHSRPLSAILCLDDRDTITRVLDSSRTSSHVDDHICSVSFSFKDDGGE